MSVWMSDSHQPDYREWTAADKQAEIDLCRTNFVYWAATWYPIIDKEQREVMLCLNHEQRIALLELSRHGWITILKARKKGITTLFRALFVWTCSFWRHERRMITAQTKEDAEEIFEPLKYAIRNMPAWLIGETSINKRTIVWGDDVSSLKCRTYKGEERGKDLTGLLATEISSYDGMMAYFAGINGSLLSVDPHRCQVILETTGREGEYKHFWYDREDGYHRVFIPWHLDPTAVSAIPIDWGYMSDEMRHFLESYREKHGLSEEQLGWWYWETKYRYAGNVKIGQQENPGDEEEAFGRGGDPFFMKKYKGCIGSVDFKRLGWLWYDDDGKRIRRPEAVPGHVYVIGADVASGSQSEESDFSAASVVDATEARWESDRPHTKCRARQLGGYKEKLKPEHFARVLLRAGKHFGKHKQCLIVPEVTGEYGTALVDELRKLMKDDEDGGRVRLYVRRRPKDAQNPKPMKKWGFYTGPTTRGPLLESYRVMHDEGRFVVFDPRQRDEHNTFAYNERGKPEHEEECHDDGVFACALCVAGFAQVPRLQVVERLMPGQISMKEYPQTIEDEVRLVHKYKTANLDEIYSRFPRDLRGPRIGGDSGSVTSVWDIPLK